MLKNLIVFCTCILLPVCECDEQNISTTAVSEKPVITCDKLQVGQYRCDEPEIDIDTQEIKGCNNQSMAKVSCRPLSGIKCSGKLYDGKEEGFQKEIPCRYTNGYSYVIAVALSLFLGWLGIDRFYLGYPAIGLMKFCTFGVCGFGALLDFLLIALQVVLPSDGSNYVIDRYGPRLISVLLSNDTYYKPQPD